MQIGKPYGQVLACLCHALAQHGFGCLWGLKGPSSGCSTGVLRSLIAPFQGWTLPCATPSAVPLHKGQCLGVRGSISTTKSCVRGPLFSSTMRGTTVDQRSLLRPLPVCCPLVPWMMSFLPGSSLIIPRF